MLASLSLLACALYLVPLAALVALARSDAEDALDLACAVGVAFCADLLVTLLLTRLFRVETAAFVRTALLLALVAAVAVRRVRRGEPALRPLGRLARGDLAALALGAVFAFALSAFASAQYFIWDREWHAPFVASLRAQRMPFLNVYDPHALFRYHHAGDVFAASLQSLSFVAMSASRALSLSHDLQSAITGGIVALALRALCAWPPASAALAALVPLLAGPMTFRVINDAPTLGAFEGDSDFNNYSLSFRPHCIVAGLVLVAFLAHVMRLARDRDAGRAPDWRRPASLALLMAIASMTDEISSVLAGLALGVLWLRWPERFGPRRWHGAAVLAGLGAAALVTNIVFGGTLAPGGPIQHAQWLAPRIPRLAANPLPLGLDPKAWKIFFFDMGSLVLPALVMAGLVLASRTVRAATLPAVLFAGLLAAGGLVLYLCFEVNGRWYEGHRFVTAGRFLVPMAALLCVARLPRTSFLSLVLLGPVLAGVFSSVGFILYRMPGKNADDTEHQYDVDCRSEFGARLGDRVVPTYVDQPIWYPYAGCRPIFAAGHDGPPGVVLAGFPKLGPGGFAKMDREQFAPGQPARVACPSDAKIATPLCKKAETVAACTPAGSRAVTCEVAPASRAAVAVP
jgi:hypothetical protein